jgi:dethiobiotin synthetase
VNSLYFITGTDTGAGKTVLTVLLAAHLRRKKIRVAALKPLCSGGRDDARKICAALGGSLSLDEINPWHFRAAIAPALAAQREKKSVKRDAVARHIQSLANRFEITLVEGAGGLMSPLGKSFDSRDLIVALGAVPLIVAPNKLGVVNHLRLTLEALPKKPRMGARIVLMAPPKPDAASRSNAELIGQFFPPEKIFTLPWLGDDFSSDAVLRWLALQRVLESILR